MPESAAGKSYVAAIRSAFCEVRSDKPVKRSPQRRYSLESAACSDEAEPGKCRRPAATCHGRLAYVAVIANRVVAWVSMSAFTEGCKTITAKLPQRSADGGEVWSAKSMKGEAKREAKP
jgi:hypothetical protein